jgi:alpha-beta hydrolase superfamily lysophospholipase
MALEPVVVSRNSSVTRHLTVLIVLSTVLMLLTGCHLADRLILYPTTNPVDASNLTRRLVPMPSGAVIEVFIARSSNAMQTQPSAYVLSFIGNAARAEFMATYFAEDWADRPVEVWAVNYPGYGGSTGPARLASIAPAALAVYDELRHQHPSAPIFLEAQSIGTTAALYVAAHRPVAGCVLHNPPPLRSLILGRFGWWNLWLIAGPIALAVPSDLDSIANAARVHAPAIFVTADADSVVPPPYQTRVVNAYAGPKQLIHLPGADHNDPPTGPELDQFQAALDHLWQNAVERAEFGHR